jgi:hypothetical protein
MNIPGRMAFSVPDLHGSICMIETGEAVNIFPPPGRGIFVHGVNRFKFQSPFITDSQIKEIIRNAQEGKTTAAMARSTELAPEEIVQWAMIENNSFLGQREAFREFSGRMDWNDLVKMLSDMEGKEYPFKDALYRVLPGTSHHARQLEEIPGEKPAAQVVEAQPPAASPAPILDEHKWTGSGPCPECGANRSETPCEYCGSM